MASQRRTDVTARACMAVVEKLEQRQLMAADFGVATTDGAATMAQFAAAAAATNPSVIAVRPGNGATNVRRDTNIANDLDLPNGGLDGSTVNANVSLVRVSDGKVVAGDAKTSGGGDSITFQPADYLDANTTYRYTVTSGVKDVTGVSMTPFTSTFTTGTLGGPVSTNIKFNKVQQATATGKTYTSVTVGPDGKLYAATMDGQIDRWSVSNNGTLGARETINTVNNANGTARTVIGIVFDPASTASNLVLWVTHTQKADVNGTNWTGKISRLSGPALGTYQDYVTGLPRSVRDHLTNQASFGPDGALYVSQGANNAMGAPDLSWGNRPENLLTAAILRVDTKALKTRIDSGKGPLYVKTVEANGPYNPYAAGAPVTLYATGVRNGYDVVWHSNGRLYTAVNGSAAGGNIPGTSATGRRPPTGAPYSGPTVKGLNQVKETEHDWLFSITKGKYYGHPNPARGEFVFNGGNPSTGADPQQVNAYPVGTKPDVNWARAAYDFGQSVSPNGMIEYKSNTFGGALKGKLLITRYAGGNDIMALTPTSTGSIDGTKTMTAIGGVSAFVDPVDLIEYINKANPNDPRNGMIFVAEYGGERITLLAPQETPISPPTTGSGAGGPATVTGVSGAKIRLNKGALVMNAVRGATGLAAKLTITNTGTTALSITGLTITGGEAANFVFGSRGGLPASLAAGASATVTIAYKAPAATTLGIHTSSLVITSNDTSKPSITVPLRGLATAGNGGQKEASLQRLFDLYQFNIRTGDVNPANTNLYSPTETLGASDEINVQRLVRANTGAPVTIQALGTFAGGSPAARFGYYPAGLGNNKTQLLSINSGEAQTVALNPVGNSSFSPTSPFGLYVNFPIFGNTAYSEDNLNTTEGTASNRRKIRFYPLKNANGSTVPNAFVFTSEDFVNGDGSFDVNDFFGIIRNVQVASTGQVTLENLDAVPFNDRMVFNRIGIQPPAQLRDPETGELYQPPNNVVHDTGSLRITNSKSTAITINSISVNNSAAWSIVGPASGTVLQPGQSATVTIKFVATSAPTTTVNETIDLTGNSKNANGTYQNLLTINTTDGVKTVELRGYYQLKNEQDQEANLQTIVNTIFGYKTQILKAGEVLNTGGRATPVGEEIMSGLWQRADASQPVAVRQLVAYQTQGDTALLSWYSSTDSVLRGLIQHSGVEAQSLLPRTTANLVGAASFNPTGTFGFKIDQEWSEDARNKQEQAGGGYGHHVRFWAARDRNGALIPDTYIMAMDYLGRNYDFQDNVFLISNIKAANGAGPTEPPPTSGPSLGGLTLLNATNDTSLGTFANGAVLDMSGGKQYTVRAEAGAATIGSVVFRVDGDVARIENFAPYSIAGEIGTDYTPWNVPSGSHVVTVTAYTGRDGTGTGGTPITVNYSTSDVPPTAFSPVNVNFQPANAPTVTNYSVDSGNVFGNRGTQSYGWSVAHTDTVVDRNLKPDQLIDTTIGVKAGAKWELAVPNGKYQVAISVGDPAVATKNNVWVEGRQLFNYVSLGVSQFVERTIEVDVADGRLTVGFGGATTGQTRLGYLRVNAPGTLPPPTPLPPTTPPPTTAGSLKFNYQPADAPTVAGYLVDAGATYGTRNGQAYGWSTSHTDVVVDRDINANQLLDTNLGVRAGAKWEVAVPNGTYTVKVGVGDAAAGSTANVWIEGRQLFNYQAVGANVFASKSITVPVTDGKLTIGVGGAGSLATKLNFVELSSSALPTEPPPPDSPPVSPPPVSPPPVSPPPVPPTTPFGVTGLTLVDAATDQDIGAVTEGMTIDFTDGKQYTVRAEVAGEPTTVAFSIDDQFFRSEGSAPFSIAGDADNGGVTDYSPWSISNGAHKITAQSYGAGGVSDPGTLVVLNVNIVGVGVTSPPVTPPTSPPSSVPGSNSGVFYGTNVGAATGSTANLGGGTIIVKGSGVGQTGTKDAFHFARQTRTGDFDIKAKLSSLTSGAAGIVLRSGTSSGNSAVAVQFSAGGIYFGKRNPFGSTFQNVKVGAGTAGNVWLRLKRVGNTFTAYYSSNGTNWTTAGTTSFAAINAKAELGFSLASGSSSLATAKFTGISG